MRDPQAEQRKRLEMEFAKQHEQDSDAVLLGYVRAQAQNLGRIPLKQEVIGFAYIKSRLGPWPRVLEKAGLKPISANRAAKLAQAADNREDAP